MLDREFQGLCRRLQTSLTKELQEARIQNALTSDMKSAISELDFGLNRFLGDNISYVAFFYGFKAIERFIFVDLARLPELGQNLPESLRNLHGLFPILVDYMSQYYWQIRATFDRKLSADQKKGMLDKKFLPKTPVEFVQYNKIYLANLSEKLSATDGYNTFAQSSAVEKYAEYCQGRSASVSAPVGRRQTIVGRLLSLGSKPKSAQPESRVYEGCNTAVEVQLAKNLILTFITQIKSSEEFQDYERYATLIRVRNFFRILTATVEQDQSGEGGFIAEVLSLYFQVLHYLLLNLKYLEQGQGRLAEALQAQGVSLRSSSPVLMAAAAAAPPLRLPPRMPAPYQPPPLSASAAAPSAGNSKSDSCVNNREGVSKAKGCGTTEANLVAKGLHKALQCPQCQRFVCSSCAAPNNITMYKRHRPGDKLCDYSGIFQEVRVQRTPSPPAAMAAAAEEDETAQLIAAMESMESVRPDVLPRIDTKEAYGNGFFTADGNWQPGGVDERSQHLKHYGNFEALMEQQSVLPAKPICLCKNKMCGRSVEQGGKVCPHHPNQRVHIDCARLPRVLGVITCGECEFIFN